MSTDAAAELRRERDLYRMLLEAERVSDVADVLRRVLAHAVEAVGAARGYVAVFPARDARDAPPLWSCAHACSPADVATMHALVSTSVIDDTLRTRRITSIASALGDPRYHDAASVLTNRITSVICAPLGTDHRGVLYLQDRVGGGVFSTAHERATAHLAELASPLVDRVIASVVLPERSAAGTGAPWHRAGSFADVLGTSAAFEDVLAALWARRGDRSPLWLVGPRGAGKALLARELHRATAADAWSEVDGRARTCPVPAGGTLLVRRLECLPEDAQRTLWRDALARGVRLLVTSRGDDGVAPDVRGALAPGRIDVPGWGDRGDDAARMVDHLGRREADRLGVAWRGAEPAALDELVRGLVASGPDEVGQRLSTALASAPGRPLAASDLPSPPTAEGRAVTDLFEGSLRPWRDARHAFQAAYLEHALRLHDRDPDATAAALGMSRSRLYEAIRQFRVGEGDGG
jgi:transcriptional regulator with GAF, ATPase, and Fis domain